MGKSTVALAVTAELKLLGLNAELCLERAKELINSGQLDTRWQMITSTEQLRREQALRDQVPIIVAESPPRLGVVYAPAEYARELDVCLRYAMRDWDCLEFLLHRDLLQSNAPYVQAGRNESQGESMAIHRKIESLLTMSGVEFERINTGNSSSGLRSAVDRIVQRTLLALRERERPSHSEQDVRFG